MAPWLYWQYVRDDTGPLEKEENELVLGGQVYRLSSEYNKYRKYDTLHPSLWCSRQDWYCIPNGGARTRSTSARENRDWLEILNSAADLGAVRSRAGPK